LVSLVTKTQIKPLGGAKNMKKILADIGGALLIVLAVFVVLVIANYDGTTKKSTVIDVTINQAEGTYFLGTESHHVNIDSNRNLTVTVDLDKKSMILEITDEANMTGIDLGHDSWNLLSGADLHRLFFEEWGANK
jgi:hypothetical protein